MVPETPVDPLRQAAHPVPVGRRHAGRRQIHFPVVAAVAQLGPWLDSPVSVEQAGRGGMAGVVPVMIAPFVAPPKCCHGVLFHLSEARLRLVVPLQQAGVAVENAFEQRPLPPPRFAG